MFLDIFDHKLTDDTDAEEDNVKEMVYEGLQRWFKKFDKVYS